MQSLPSKMICLD